MTPLQTHYKKLNRLKIKAQNAKASRKKRVLVDPNDKDKVKIPNEVVLSNLFSTELKTKEAKRKQEKQNRR